MAVTILLLLSLIDAGKIEAGTCLEVTWHRNWLKGDANSIMLDVENKASGGSRIDEIDCIGSGINAIDWRETTGCMSGVNHIRMWFIWW